METNKKLISRMVQCMVKIHTYTPMKIYMKENLRMVN